MHLSGLGGHFGRDKNHGLVSQKYFWHQMRKDIKNLSLHVEFVNFLKEGNKIQDYIQPYYCP